MVYEEKKDLFQNISEMMKSWADAQQKWVQSMVDTATRGAQQVVDHLKAAATTDALRSIAELWGKSGEEMIRRLRQFAPPGPAGDVYDKMLSAQSAYLKVMQWWADAMMALRGGTAMDPKSLVELWARSYKEFLTCIVVPPFAEPLKVWIAAAEGGRMPLSVSEYAQAMVQIAQQWMEFMAKAGERVAQALRGDLKPDAAREMYDSWLRAYEETIGRLFRIPTVGPARQMIDRQLKGIDAYMKYQAALIDFYSKMVQPGMEALNELAVKTQELASAPVTLETFEKFYQLLLKTAEARFTELFKSPPFLVALENTLRSSLEFYAQMNELMEEQLKSTPIVTRRELDEVHKELHELKKELRALKKS